MVKLNQNKQIELYILYGMYLQISGIKFIINQLNEQKKSHTHSHKSNKYNC